MMVWVRCGMCDVALHSRTSHAQINPSSAMGRTLKRQRARARKEQDYLTPVATEDELWKKVEDALLGLLDIQVDNSTTDVDHKCPQNVQLVVRLDLVRSGANGKVENVLQQVMDALGVLCVLAQEFYNHSEEFWTRVISSHMIQSPSWDGYEDQAKISGTVAFVPAHGFQVILSWQSRRFQSYAADAIGDFLQSPRRKYRVPLLGYPVSEDSSARLVRVGLEFIECKLAACDLIRVMEALAVPELTSESDVDDVPLCGPHSLASLEFKSVTFGVAGLNALAAGLTSPHTRRVDSLSLENAIVLTNSPKYQPAFRRVMLAALQAKHIDAASCCPGLKLSLADNSVIQAVHIEALQEALTLATRPLASLSVAGIQGGDVGTWLRLGQILFTPSRIPVDGAFEFDMSRVTRERDAVETLSVSLGNIVTELMPRVGAALLASVNVYCRVLEPTADLLPHDQLRVLSVRISGLGSSGWLLVETPPGSAESSTWVSSSSVTSLGIGDDAQVCCRFTRLVMNGNRGRGDNNEAIVALTQLIGHRLQRVMLGKRDSIETVLLRVMDNCPNVEVLGLSGTSVYQRGYDTSWKWTRDHRNIQAICLNQCYLSDTSVVSLLSLLAESAHHSLRYLDLRVYFRLEVKILEAMLELVKANRALVCVDIDERVGICPPQRRPCSLLRKDETKEEAELRACIQEIDDFLLAEYLSPEIKLAFLGVLRALNYVHVDGNIVRTIFDYTGSRYQRLLRRD